MSPTPARAQLLLAVVTGATLLVGAAAVVAHAVFFPPRYRGWGEVTAEGRIAGWMVDERAPGRRVEVQVYVDGRLVAAGPAELPRPDVVAAGRARDERCGYSFPAPALAPGLHEARVFATHAVAGGSYVTLQMTGKPLPFTVDEAGRALPTGP
jgi:hypothetical protein